VVRLGVVDVLATSLEVQGLFDLPINALREAHEGTLPKHFG
jgi:phosphoribosylformylglycinamidine synthase